MDEWLEKTLDSFADSIKFYKNTAPIDEIAPFLRVSQHEMEKYSSEDCAMICVLLNQYYLFLTRAYNRENARLKMYETSLTKACAKRWSEFKDVFGSTDLKIAIIASTDDGVKDIMAKRDKARILMTDLDGLAMAVKQCADSWKQLDRAKNG